MLLREYIDPSGRSPFGRWFDALPAVAAMHVTQALAKLETGLTGNMKSVGAGVHELKVDHGPGYRVYFARDGNALIVLLGGGAKKRQNEDIRAATERWRRYKKTSRK